MRPFRTLNPVKFLFYILSLTSFLQSVQATILLCFYITKNIELEKMCFSSVSPQIYCRGYTAWLTFRAPAHLQNPVKRYKWAWSLKSEVHQNYPFLKSFHSLLCREDKSHFLYIVYVLCPILEMHLLWSNSKNANVFKVNMMEGWSLKWKVDCLCSRVTLMEPTTTRTRPWLLVLSGKITRKQMSNF